MQAHEYNHPHPSKILEPEMEKYQLFCSLWEVKCFDWPSTSLNVVDWSKIHLLEKITSCPLSNQENTTHKDMLARSQTPTHAGTDMNKWIEITHLALHKLMENTVLKMCCCDFYLIGQWSFSPIQLTHCKIFLGSRNKCNSVNGTSFKAQHNAGRKWLLLRWVV